MNKNIMMSEKFVIDTYKLLQAINKYEFDNYTTQLIKSLESQIEAKIEAMKKRELYTKSKTGVNEAEREQARKEYLEAAEIKEDFRY